MNQIKYQHVDIDGKKIDLAQISTEIAKTSRISKSSATLISTLIQAIMYRKDIVLMGAAAVPTLAIQYEQFPFPSTDKPCTRVRIRVGIITVIDLWGLMKVMEAILSQSDPLPKETNMMATMFLQLFQDVTPNSRIQVMISHNKQNADTSTDSAQHNQQVRVHELGYAVFAA